MGGRNEQGFTLTEVLLSVVIIGMLVGLSLPVYASFQSRSDTAIATQNVADMLRRAQTYARGVNGDSQWGVAIQSETATLFKGASYATRDASYDETTSLSGATPSGLSEIVFSKLSATPTTTGTITLTKPNNIRTITVNAKGMVSY